MKAQHADRSILAGLALSSALAGGAFAQTAPAAASGSGVRTQDAVIVTARLRDETQQDVPLSIATFSETAIERQRIDTLDRLSFLVPSLSASDPFGRNNPSVSMRGIGLAGIGDELPVGIFIDGVYVSGRSSANLLLTDLERIEVARGPQSALYGRNTFAGAINFITRKPTDTPEGFGEVTVGDKDRYEARAGFSGPLVEGLLAGHLGVIRRDWGGFFENQNPAGPDLNRQETTAVNAALRLTPNAAFEANLRLNYAEDEDSTAAAFLVPANVALTLSNGGSLGFFRGDAPENPPPGIVCCSASDGVQGFSRETFRAALTLTYDVSDALTVTSISAFTQEDQLYDQDVDYLADKLFTFGNIINREDVSQEVRIAYAGERLTALAGVFAYNFRNKFRNVAYAQFFLPPAARSANPLRNNGPFLSITETQAVAVFGSLGYELQPGLNATLDLRWGEETKTFDYFRGAAFVADPRRKATWDSWTPRFILDWKPTANSLWYVSAAKGFKTGGFNDQINIFDTERAYAPETNWTYEIGTKQALFDQRLLANLTLFYVDWTNQQVVSASSRGPANNTFIANAAQSYSQGFELDLTARPTDRIDLTAAISLSDAKFDSYVDPALAGVDRATGQIAALPGLRLVQLPNGVFGADVSGNRLPRASKWQAAVSGQYTHPLADAELYARADLTFRSTQFSEPSNFAGTGDQTRVNLRIGYETDRFSIAGFVDNVFDDRTPPVIIRFSDFNSFFAQPFPGALKRAFQVTPADGRTFGLTARYKFGG
ncbi:TonB-dependent receptor [Aphanothece microscopica]|uniref:TonB-dependent receptor n=1 Tax=Aphanothece microscopica TaxID=1049561 RepID=UPI0039849859